MKKIAKIDLGYFGTTNESELKKKVADFVKLNLVGKKFNFKQGVRLIIELTWQGLKNDINEYHRNYIEKLVSFGVLDEIISNSVFLYLEADKNNKPGIKVYRFFSRVVISERDYDVIIIVKKTAKTFIYDHILIEK